MALYSTTAATLIERVATLLGDWYTGTVDSGSITTIVDADRVEDDNFFADMSPPAHLYITGTTDDAAPIGESRRITKSEAYNGQITVAPAFSATTGASDTYAITHLKTWAEHLRFLNIALEQVKGEVLIPHIDETVTIVAADYEYNIPTDFTHIYRVTQADADGYFYDSPIPPDQYTVIRAASTPQLHFKQVPDDMKQDGHWYGQLWFNDSATADRKLRIEGFKVHPLLTADSTVCYVSPTYMVAQSAALIHASMIRREDSDADWHSAQYRVWQAVADAARKDKGFATIFPPNTKRVK